MAAGSSSQNASNKMYGRNSQHATNSDIMKLATSLTDKVQTLYPLSQDCCIYRVPQPLRCFNPSDYTPKMVSIGPIHHGKEELQAMEDHKIRYLRNFLQRTKVSMEDFLVFIKNKEAKLRNCYAETILLESDDFVRIILVDSVFLIELCLRRYDPSFRTADDRIWGKPWMVYPLRFDLWLVENQLPFFILIDLFNKAKTTTYGGYYDKHELTEISCWLMEDVLDHVPIVNNLLENHFPKALHLLDWLRLCLQPSRSPTKTEYIYTENIPSAKELYQAGVKIIKSDSSKNLHDVKFNEGILEVPFLRVYDDTERLFQNILVFEDMHCRDHYFNDYILLMSYLISTTKDAELLIEKGVIGCRSSEELSTIFQNLNKSCAWHPNFQYSDDVGRLQKHYKYRYNKWKAILKQNYFNSPWASISVIAAVILLVLTFIQTTCSIIAL